MDSLKMATLEEINGRAGLDKEQDLGGFVDAQEIRDGLLGTIIEQVEVFAAQAADKLPVRIGDDDSYIDAVHSDADAGRRRCRLLGKGGSREQESAWED